MARYCKRRRKMPVITSAQTMHGSVVVGVHAVEDGSDMWELSIDESRNSRRGRLLFIGTLQELIEQLEK